MQREFVAMLDSNGWVSKALAEKDKTKHLGKWRNQVENQSDIGPFALLPKISVSSQLPTLSLMLNVPFRLRKPYLSKDDDAFYVIDNPVRKDKVFKVPYVASTGWKGSLRAAATRGLLDAFTHLLLATPASNEAERATLLQALWAERARRVALFGNEKENQATFLNRWLASRLLPEQPDHSAWERRKQVQEEADRLGQEFEQYLIQHGYRTEKIEGRQGRLFCFPTFFDKIGLEVINPHDRQSGVGARGPILMECVRIGAKGTFTLLYVPFDRIGHDETETRRQVAEDLVVLAQGVQAMLTTYGFGAKTSSGFGVVEDRLAGEGKLAIRAELTSEAVSAAAPSEQPQPDLPRYLESPSRLHPDFLQPDGSLKSEEEYQALIESRGQKYTKKDKQLYAKAQSWWEREGQKLAQGASQEPEHEPQPVPAETPPVSEYTFHSLSELCAVAQHVAEQLQEGGKP